MSKTVTTITIDLTDYQNERERLERHLKKYFSQGYVASSINATITSFRITRYRPSQYYLQSLELTLVKKFVPQPKQTKLIVVNPELGYPEPPYYPREQDSKLNCEEDEESEEECDETESKETIDLDSLNKEIDDLLRKMRNDRRNNDVYTEYFRSRRYK